MAIELEGVFAGYGSPKKGNNVLKDLSFRMEEGHTICILGENGSGKSTLLRVLAGILSYSGSIRIDDTELAGMNRRSVSEQVAFMTQFSSVYFSYSVWDTVMLGRYLKMDRFLGTPSEKDKQRVLECLQMTGLEELKHCTLDTLSGGQLQRVFLARTLAQDTPYILLDEPTNHLDLKYQSQLIQYLQEWTGMEREYPDGRIRKNTLIGVFHDINLALQIADELIVMKSGELLAIGNQEQILSTDVLTCAFGIDVATYMKAQRKLWE